MKEKTVWHREKTQFLFSFADDFLLTAKVMMKQ